jgi:hypothetical protein
VSEPEPVEDHDEADAMVGEAEDESVAESEPGFEPLEMDSDDEESDESIVGATIELSYDGEVPATEDPAPEEEAPPDEPRVQERPAAKKSATPEETAVDEENLDDEVDRVITLGVDDDISSAQPVGEPDDVDEVEDAAQGTPVVALGYDDDTPADEPGGEFEEIDESRPIKMRSAPKGQKRAKKKPVRKPGADTSSQRHRRSIDEKENFNYFKRWLDRMQT